MRRGREDAASDHFDLLPFVSILLCTLGCLLFITLSVATVSLAKPVHRIQSPTIIEWGDRVSVIREKNSRQEVAWSRREWDALTSERIRRTGRGMPAPLASALDRVAANSKDQFAYFVVRPSGFTTFTFMFDICRKRNIEIGYDTFDETETVEQMTTGEGK